MSGTFVENIQNIVNVTRDKLKNLKPLLSTIAILLLFVIKKTLIFKFFSTYQLWYKLKGAKNN